MKCPKCSKESAYQLDRFMPSVCISCGIIVSWMYVYTVQSASQSNADRATLEQLAIEQLRAKLAGKVGD